MAIRQEKEMGSIQIIKELYIAIIHCGNLQQSSCYEKEFGNSLKKLDTELACDSAIPLLGRPKVIKNVCSHKNLYIKCS